MVARQSLFVITVEAIGPPPGSIRHPGKNRGRCCLHLPRMDALGWCGSLLAMGAPSGIGVLGRPRNDRTAWDSTAVVIAKFH